MLGQDSNFMLILARYFYPVKVAKLSPNKKSVYQKLIF